MEYIYLRISKKTQSIERQRTNLVKIYPNARVYEEAFTGTKIEGRKEFNKLLKVVKAGDTIAFDSVSRMSRNAEEGTKLYFELFDKGVNLVFLKEPYINTDVYKESLNNKIELQGTTEDILFEAINKYLRELAKKQIVIAFEQAEKEVKDIRERTAEGLREARRNGKQIGNKQGAKLNVKKKEPIKSEILKKSKDFNGTMTDRDLIKVLGIARNTYYKYKAELRDDNTATN